MSDVGFAPGDISVRGTPPLVGTFEKSEMEVAAACMVVACQDHFDWFAMLPQDMGRALERRPALTWQTNPFCRPDFHALVAKGWAEWVDDGTDPKRIAFTWAGLERLRFSRWLVCSGPAYGGNHV